MEPTAWNATLGALFHGMAFLTQQTLGSVQWPNSHWNDVARGIQGKPAGKLAREIAAASLGKATRLGRLAPIFTHLNGEHPGKQVPVAPLGDEVRFPIDHSPVGQSSAVSLAKGMLGELAPYSPVEEQLPGILSVLEKWTSAVSVNADAPDISLFDRVKWEAALAACIASFYKEKAPQALASMRDDNCFLLFSADVSGIQKFIYTVATNGALRNLRARSFFLDLLMEHFVDETLAVCGMSRANLLYSGGGHCYILLPALSTVEEALESWGKRCNRWLTEQFGIQLYISYGWTPCSVNDLTNAPAEKAPYKEMFRRVSSQVSGRKIRRYSPEDIRYLNNSQKGKGDRECKICGRPNHLVGDLCVWCDRLKAFSARIVDPSRNIFVISESRPSVRYDLVLPSLSGEYGVTACSLQAAKAFVQGEDVPVRIYTKNCVFSQLPRAVRIDVGSYAAETSMEKLAGSAQGISRIAVCRMDIDNLGQAFVAEFEDNSAKDLVGRYRYVTLIRTAAFSRQISLYFRRYINSLMGGQKPLQVSVVYSGGDDVFLVGGWDSVIQAALRIQQGLEVFTCGSLTISGGISLYDPHYPIRLAAEKTADLEDLAKGQPGKNAVALFHPEEKAVFSWSTFEDRVLGEKLKLLRLFFQGDDPEQNEEQKRGFAFLYHLLELLRNTDREQIHLARYAYLLARMEPPRKSPQFPQYQFFAKKMYQWALEPCDRAELTVAIMLYVYENRRSKDNHEK